MQGRITHDEDYDHDEDNKYGPLIIQANGIPIVIEKTRTTHMMTYLILTELGHAGLRDLSPQNESSKE